jgi:hypothetical protein
MTKDEALIAVSEIAAKLLAKQLRVNDSEYFLEWHENRCVGDMRVNETAWNENHMRVIVLSEACVRHAKYVFIMTNTVLNEEDLAPLIE